MTVSTLQEQIEADVSVLLMRALLNKTVVAFGDDGLGKHGRDSQAHQYLVEDMAIDVIFDEDTGDITGAVAIFLAGYNSSKVGHICSDQNFLISLRKHLIAESIDPDSLSYAEIDVQSDDFVMMEVDVQLLMDWA